MTRNRGHFDRFQAHTRTKHLILETYIQAWARKLLLRPGATRKLVYIDACAGRGHDSEGNSGSPVIAAREAAKAVAQVQEMKGYSTSIQVIAIEKDPGHFRDLQALLAPFGDTARALYGELGDYLPALLTESGEAPVLCFVDPFGLDPLRADLVRMILRRPHSEVLALFADQAALRHIGAAAAESAADVSRIPDLFGIHGISLASAPNAGSSTDRARTVTAHAAERILDNAFASLPWRDRLLSRPASQRRQASLDLYEEFLHLCGAPYVLRIPIRNNRNQHVYHLVHASHSAHGYRAIKEAVSSALNKTDLSAHAVTTMRFTIRSDLTGIAREVATRFSGKMVPWTTTNDQGFGPLKDYLLENTALFPHECEELKRLLQSYRSVGQKIVYAFPAIEADEPPPS